MTQVAVATHRRRFGIDGALYSANARAVLWRGWRAASHANLAVMISGFFEPVFYLLSFGVGLGGLIGSVAGDDGRVLPYAAYIAPALLATSAMNGAIYDSTWNVFFKLNQSKLYDGMLATRLGPLDVALGEIGVALIRGAVYAAGFMVVMTALGLTLSWWALAALPATVLIAFGFASLGMAVTSYMKTFQQMDWINFVLLPMFLLSATFYPLSVYPSAVQVFIQAMPLWHAVELVRSLTTGNVGWSLLWHVAYFAVMSVVGIRFTTVRLRALFLR
ncbi:ABC transporter permease [Rarobacter incanus]|nr:ABC transporter permease [Rarobacter incanus]